MHSRTESRRLFVWLLAVACWLLGNQFVLAWNPFVPEPIFDAFLGPMFHQCGCPVYGIEEVLTWEDQTDPSIVYYQVRVVLSVRVGSPAGWLGESREYLFKMNGDGVPTMEAIADPEPWPNAASLND